MDKLQLDSTIKTFGTHQILNNIFLECKTGDIVGLLGRNGSGKSTLLKIIFGTVKADFKFLKINNQVLKSLRKTTRYVSYLPQETMLPKEYNVKTLLTFFAGKGAVKKAKENPFLKKLLATKAGNLSGGEQKIIEVFMIFNSKSKFVLLDEPFKGVSPVNRSFIKELIQENSKSKGIIVTDHDYSSILEISSEVQLLDNGNLRKISQKEDLIQYGYLPD
ncbi:ATP-binding cassette domain-containing protein [uncultured Tenacibaculum sp.]|uniref:ATP-binding cassette domain-containing protein n=1 Tax=uncultured Tenacibaculum sp. TaxID=174713 RepID=UPI00262AF871|nr:ATP-binding cassette domain-containing protein [uncultured Tenacibaculum sp.]